MPRTARKLLGNIFIHNMMQGINKEYIFQNDYQKNKYINLMRKYAEKHKVLIVAYCIMDNHAHLLTYSEDIKNISLFMKDLNTEYAIYYNKSNDRVGYVFRNRFCSKPICSQEQLLTCIKYIHMNPVKAKISDKEGDYKFSSYNEYLNQNGFINSNILDMVFNSKEEYLEKFYTIKYQIMNLEKEKVNLEEAFKKFIIQRNLKSNQIPKDALLIKQFISYLISNEYEFTKKEIACVLNISRASLYRKLNEGENKK